MVTTGTAELGILGLHRLRHSHPRRPLDWRRQRLQLLQRGIELPPDAVDGQIARRSQQRAFQDVQELRTGPGLQRAELEARLLARQDIADIATRMDMRRRTLQAYLWWNFDLGSRINCPSFAIGHAIGTKIWSGVCLCDTDVLLKFVAYNRGLGELELLLEDLRAHGGTDFDYLAEFLADVEQTPLVVRHLRQFVRTLVIDISDPRTAKAFLRHVASRKQVLENSWSIESSVEALHSRACQCVATILTAAPPAQKHRNNSKTQKPDLRSAAA